MKATRETYVSVRDSENPVVKSYMTEHSIGAALYAQIAVGQAGKSVDDERIWQDEKMQDFPCEIAKLLEETIWFKVKSFRELHVYVAENSK